MTQPTSQLYIELYSYKSAWQALETQARQDFIGMVQGAIADMEKAGVNVIGFGFNDTNTDRRANYDFFCVYTMPNADFARTFEQQVDASGWYQYFDQVNASGPVLSVAEALTANINLASPGAQ